MPTHDSLADIHERLLVERLMASPYWRSCLLRIEGVPDGSVPLQCVSLTGLPGRPQGDIDILLIVPGRPDCATAIQVKRIKVGAAALRNQSPNGLQGFEKGVRQANVLAEIGFSLVFFYVFVLVDSRQGNAGRISYEGLTPQVKTLIEQALSPADLNERVGLMSCELVQPMDVEPLIVPSSTTNLLRRAVPAAQPADVTAWVARLAASGGSR